MAVLQTMASLVHDVFSLVLENQFPSPMEQIIKQYPNLIFAFAA